MFQKRPTTCHNVACRSEPRSFSIPQVPFERLQYWSCRTAPKPGSEPARSSPLPRPSAPLAKGAVNILAVFAAVLPRLLAHDRIVRRRRIFGRSNVCKQANPRDQQPLTSPFCLFEVHLVL